MSGNNPYAVNPAAGYGGPGSGSYRNDPYLAAANGSSTSVNSFASGRDRRTNTPAGSSNPYEQNQQVGRSSPAPRAGAPTRPGGYGGFGPTTPAPSSTPPTQEFDRRERFRNGPREGSNGLGVGGSGSYAERDRAYSNSRSRDRASPRMRSNSSQNVTPPATVSPPPAVPPLNANSSYTTATMSRTYSPGKSMDGIMKHIQSNWKMMEGDECIPVKLAVQLMDPSSLGLQEKEGDFANTYVDLQKCLKGVVNEHYADFNSAVGTYHKIQAGIRESQNRVRILKSGLINVKSGMLGTRPELRGLAEQSGELDDLSSLLTLIQNLKEVPTKLEERISEKRFLGAVDCLLEALRGVRRSELDDISAMSDLRSYFANQEQSLVDILVEELHDHLYLKSPYCQDRWKGRNANGEEKDAKSIMNGAGVNAWDRPVYHYLSALDTSTAMVEDASKNPEADTFYYVHMVVESLHKLGHLDEAISRIEQRMPVELYKVVDKTSKEVDAKHPIHLRSQLGRLKLAALHLQPNDSRSQVLSDFLWTLYSKFEAIAEGHRVLHEVVVGIVKRDQLANPTEYTGGFKELWKLYQMEIRSLLHDYLATNTEITTRAGKISAVGLDVFNRQPRDKNKKMFKLSEMDEKAVSLRAEEEELDEILKTSVPGLVSRTRAKIDTNSDRHDGNAAGHKLLVEPSVFNVTMLLPPSLTFLQRLKDIVPPTSNIAMSTLTSFLDDFLVNVFHPQLEEAVTELCAQNLIDVEAFTEDSQWSRHSPHPIFKGTISFMTLINAFSGMLSSIPQDQLFTQLIIGQLVTYYDKCYGLYKTIVSRVAPTASNLSVNKPTMKTPAVLAESGDVHDIAVELIKTDLTPLIRKRLMAKEVEALLSATKQNPLTSYDIISDPKSVHQLSLLYNSMEWLSAALTQLRHVETLSKSSHSRNPSQVQNHPRRWTLITNLKSSRPTSRGVFLPLNNETAIPFDTTLASFHTLAQTALLTLHIDIRCGIIHQLSRTLRGPDVPGGPGAGDPRDSSALPSLESGAYPFVLPSPPSSASALVLELNSDLISFDENVSSFLGAAERKFIVSGLAKLVDKYLVIGADKVGVMNQYGAERMRVDAMVIQQNLRGIIASALGAEGKERNVRGESTTGTNPRGLGIAADPNATALNDHNANKEQEGLLPLSLRYYDLLLQGPDEIMKLAQEQKDRQKKKATATNDGNEAGSSDDVVATSDSSDDSEDEYNYDELRTLIELCFSSILRGEDREEALRAKKRVGDLLLRLGEICWDS